MGLTLCVLMLTFAVYLFLCPKDPLQTVARVVAPLAELNRPSRVLIEEVTPGHAKVYSGRQLDVMANVHGMDDDDSVAVVFSSVDGQIVDQRLNIERLDLGICGVNIDRVVLSKNQPAVGEVVFQSLDFSLGQAVGRSQSGPRVRAINELAGKPEFHIREFF